MRHLAWLLPVILQVDAGCSLNRVMVLCFLHWFGTWNIHTHRKSLRLSVTSDNTQDVNTKFLKAKGKCFILPLQPPPQELTGSWSPLHPQTKGPLCLKGTKKLKRISIQYAIAEKSATFSIWIRPLNTLKKSKLIPPLNNFLGMLPNWK